MAITHICPHRYIILVALVLCMIGGKYPYRGEVLRISRQGSGRILHAGRILQIRDSRVKPSLSAALRVPFCLVVENAA
jgi:hypothetical protein